MALHYPPLTRNVGCFTAIAATLAVCAVLGVTGAAAGPTCFSDIVGNPVVQGLLVHAMNRVGNVAGIA